MPLSEGIQAILMALVSEDIFQEHLFPSSYLNDLPKSRTYGASNFATFSTMEIGGITILNLPNHFVPFTKYDEKDNNLHTYWLDLAKLCKSPLLKQIKELYGYRERIELFPGYPNIKEYLDRGIIRNGFLWTQFVSECMLDAAKKVSGPEGNVETEMEIINLPYHSNTQKKHILKYIKEVRSSLEEQDWSADMRKVSNTNEKFLILIKWALQSIGLVERNK